MKYFLVLCYLLISFIVSAQTMILDKGSDTLQAQKQDTVYKVGFTLAGVRIGSLPVVRVVATGKGSALNQIEYTMYDQDSVITDSVALKAKNNVGSFMLYVKSGLKEIKSAVLAVSITDNGKTNQRFDTVILVPFKVPEKPKEPEKKDSLVITLTKEEDVRVYDTLMTIRKRVGIFFHRNKKADAAVNIESVNIELQADGKYKITVLAADGDEYSNETGLDINHWSGNYKLLKKGDGKPYLLIKDFLELNVDKKENQSQTLTPQHKAIKVPKN